MTDIRVHDFTELHAASQRFGRKIVAYRGERLLNRPLKPKIGRYKKIKTANLQQKEATILRLFKEQAIAFTDSAPKTPWDWLAIAQHHGLPTRLLDWSRNLMVAAFFSVENADDGDSVVYAFVHNIYINIERHTNPFEVRTVGRFIPRHVTPRITAQTCLFTIHPNPLADFRSDPRLTRIIIDSEFRRPLKRILDTYGIHRASLFPGMDGLSCHIEYLQAGEKKNTR